MPRVNLDEIADVGSARARELIALDDALSALAEIDARKAQVIELRFFGGLSVEETAEVLKVQRISDAGLENGAGVVIGGRWSEEGAFKLRGRVRVNVRVQNASFGLRPEKMSVRVRPSGEIHFEGRR